MERSHLTRAAKYLADLRRRTVWRKVVSLLSVMVVFCTVYALVLPAITMTRPTICGQEEHTHTEQCYVRVPDSEGPTFYCGMNEHISKPIDVDRVLDILKKYITA